MAASIAVASSATAAEDTQGLLDVLLENGSITKEQYESLGGGTSEPPSRDAADAAADAASDGSAETASAPADAAEPELPPVSGAGDAEDERINERIANEVAKQIEAAFPVKASYGSKGFRLETKDGNWQTNLQWRAQMRLTWPRRSDPRQVSQFSFNRPDERITFENRRLRMKIGGHGYKPWLKYYFEVDLQPTRDSDDSSSNASARVIDWRIDVAKSKKIGIRVGQWKIDYNRERVDSSGRQQFVERSIVNRTFTIDRQVGVSLRGRLFEGTPADVRYAFGVFTGEGRGVNNDDNNLMYTARIQWNFLGRDLKLRQTDVERTEKPTGSFAIGAAKHTGVCTRWSSSGCGNLDGFTSAGSAGQGQFRVYQAVAELAFKWQGFSFQSEGHWKRVIDRALDEGDANHDHNLTGLYVQTGYFFNEIFEAVPEELELAFRYAIVREPNASNLGTTPSNRLKSNTREEYTAAANWFFAGHNNKLTLDYSYLTLDDDVLARFVSDHRVRFQWDISF
ncbi:MAG: porin [Myxococcota bacterium]